jgi:flagellar biogenesis protein FliO
MSFDYYYKVLISLVIIGGFLYAFYILSQKYRQKIFEGELKVTDRASIDKGVHVVTIDYKQSRYLVGVSDKTFTVIDQFSLSTD